jgi:hypothetical protein
VKHYAVDTIRKARTVVAIVMGQWTFIKTEIHKKTFLIYGQRVYLNPFSVLRAR